MVGSQPKKKVSGWLVKGKHFNDYRKLPVSQCGHSITPWLAFFLTRRSLPVRELEFSITRISHKLLLI